jgi:hypothetical protein
VTVRLFAGAAAAAGTRQTIVAAESISEVRSALIETFGEQIRSVLTVSSLLVDGTVVPPSLDDRHLSEFDSSDPGAQNRGQLIIDVLPPYAGG